MKTVDYKKHPPGIIITKTTMDVLLKREKPDQLIALYLFYCYTSCWQQTLQIRATTAYAAKGLKWSTQKVQRVKKTLTELGLVQDVQNRAKGQFAKRYLHLYYFTVQGKTPCTVKTTPKCLVTGNNKCLETNTCTPKRGGSRKTVIEEFDKVASQRLQRYILTQKNITLNTNTWANTFRLLRTQNKVSKKRIKKVLTWYGHHIGEDYVPVAHGARTFREKFTRIEDAMKRSEQESCDKESCASYRMGGDGQMGYFEDEE